MGRLAGKMEGTLKAGEWAVEEFGAAELGNTLRTERLVTLATRMAESPKGMVTSVFSAASERVGAYRFLESGRISVRSILASCAQAAIRRAAGAEWMFVAVDGSSLTFRDRCGRRGLGAIGTYRQASRGLKTMTSIGIGMDGTPLGLLDLQWWTRQATESQKGTRFKRQTSEKETKWWLEAIRSVEAACQRAGSGTRPWFQLDREGDFHDLLCSMSTQTTGRITVRVAQNRRVASGDVAYLWDEMHSQAAGGSYAVAVSAAPQRQARQAHMVVRWAQVDLLLRKRPGGAFGRTPTRLWAVLAMETGTVPAGEKPVQWLLLTNAPIANFYAAAEVLFGYSLRWRVEEFHRTWKSECQVEQCQLHQAGRIQLWATILAAVAMRIERLKYLARNEPETPASVEFTRNEIDAVIVLRRPAGYHRGETPSIAQVVRWVADLGGYIGPSNGPPGAKVISRGLQRVEPVALALLYLDQEKPA